MVRAGDTTRLGGLGKTGYCHAIRRKFHGIREHLIFTPGGLLARVVQVPGNRHDVQGLYALLKTTFRGHLIGDNAYWPQAEMDPQLVRQGIVMTAATRRGFGFQYPNDFRSALRHERGQIERRISLFNRQFFAGRTLNRSERHYLARRATKALALNSSRHVNYVLDKPYESVAHFHSAS